MLRFSRFKFGRPTAGTTTTTTTTAASASTSSAAPKKNPSGSKIPKKLWSPLGARSSSTPRQVISGAEMASIFYRRLPLDRTVEAEEDVAHNLVLHREFVSKKAAVEGMPWDHNPEARSHIEQRVAKATIARGVNQIRRSIATRMNESYTPVLEVSNTIEGTPGSIETARYIFDDARMKYCDRFLRHYAGNTTANDGSAANDGSNLKMNSTTVNLGTQCQALLETCAILYGCETDEGREAWFQYFLQLDRASLEELEEKRMNQSELLESFSTEKNLNYDERSNAKNNHSLTVMKQAEIAENNKPNEYKIKEIPSEFADIYASFQAYCSGQSPTFGNSSSILNNSDITEQAVLRKFKYRKLLELLIDEQPLSIFPSSNDARIEALVPEMEAVEVAIELDNQLQSMKLYGLRIGESVKEALMLQETRGSGGPDIAMSNKPFDMSPHNPDRVQPGSLEKW